MSLIPCSIINLCVWLISSIFVCLINGMLDDHKNLIFQHCSSQKLDGDEHFDARTKLFEKLHFQSFYSKFNSTFVMVDDESESSFSGFFHCRQDLDQRRCNECIKAFRNVSMGLCGNSMAARIQLSGCQVQYEADKYNAIFNLHEELNHNKCGEKQYIISTEHFYEMRSSAFQVLESEIAGGHGYGYNGFYSINHEGFQAKAQCEVGIDECKCAKCVVEAVDVIQQLPDCQNSIDGQLFLGLCYLTYVFNPHHLRDDQDNSFHLGQPGSAFGKVAAIAIGSVLLLFVAFMLLRCLKKKDDDY